MGKVFDGEFSKTEVVYKELEDGISFSLEFSHVMGLAMWALYQGLTVILLINILIALMNSTYSQVLGNADVEWKYTRAFYQIQFLHPRGVFPPPFRWFYYFADFVWKLRNFNNAKISLKKPQSKREYYSLVKRLLETKMHSDTEERRENSFKDLRKDIRNMVNPKGNVLCMRCKEANIT